MLLGEDGTAYLTGRSSEQSPVDTVAAVDTSNGNVKWTANTTSEPDLSTVTSDGSLVFQSAQGDNATHTLIADPNGNISPLFANSDGSDAGPVLTNFSFGLHIPFYWTLGIWFASMPDGGLGAITGSGKAETEAAPVPVSGAEPQRQHVGSPTATITVRFDGPKSPGDQLAFSGDGSCSQTLALWYCQNLSWSFYVEGAATVSDDAAKWKVRQNAVISRSGDAKDSQGVLRHIRDSFNSDILPGDDDPCVLNDSRPGCEGIVSVQQPSGQKSIFWLDHPGSLYKASSDAVWDSLNETGQFTSRVCNRFGICKRVNWFILLIVDPGSMLDSAQSLAGLGTGPNP